jgi:glycosyltransferase involved in cell wall biosynthesis
MSEISTKPVRVLFFCTSYQSTNGYSYVGYEIAKQLSKREDIHLTMFGFQRFHSIPNHRTEYPDNVYEYDAFANEIPKQHGFGINQVKDFVTVNKPDVCIVYNDMMILHGVISQLLEVPNRNFKIIAYIDQVYLCQKRHFIDFINKTCDVAMMFSPFWEENAKKIGIKLPTCYLCHGFNKMAHFPIPKELARTYFGLSMDDFIVMNLNRNQPRKRWDICMMSFALVLSKMRGSNIKLLISTALTGGWDLLEVYYRELEKYDISMEEGMRHVIIMDLPQQQTDDDINFMYNVADVQINTSDGSGWELCTFQPAGIGQVQLSTHIGGCLDYLNEENTIVIEPVAEFYIDQARDNVGGRAQMPSHIDFANGIIRYYNDRELMKLHGQKLREKITTEYPWEKISDHLCNIIHKTVNDWQEPETMEL